MKRWTLMLVPGPAGTTKRMNVNAAHLWGLALLIIGLVGFSVLVVLENRSVNRRIEELRLTTRSLLTLHQQGLDREIGLRDYYQEKTAAIQQELDRLFAAEIRERRLSAGLAGQTAGQPPAEGENENFWRSGVLAILSGFAQRSPDGEGEELNGQGGESTGLGEALLDLILDPDETGCLSGEAEDPGTKESRQENFEAMLEQIARRIDQIARLPSLVPTAARRWRVTSGFGVRRDPFGNHLRHHQGIDVAARRGANVRATASGRVVYAKTIKTLGRSVRIDHGNGIHTLYGHLMSFSVEPGQRVERGQLIGKLGNSGQSSGPHVHYEVRIHNRPVDPDPYFDGLDDQMVSEWPEAS